MSQNESLLIAALGYAARGWRVFPVHPILAGRCSCRKRNCNAVGKHSCISGWPDNATTDERVIRAWWEKWPEANIGIATGRRSNLIVIDVDNKNGKQGTCALEKLRLEHGWNPQTFKVKTASGFHYYFQHPDENVSGGVSALGSGVDVQGEGRCVIAAPSWHQTGLRYECQDTGAAVACLPKSIVTLLLLGNEPLQDRIPEGQRNQALTRLAGVKRRKGMPESQLAEFLLLKNQELCEPPLLNSEVRTIAQSVARYQPAEPNLFWMPLTMSDWDASLIVKSGTSSERGIYASLIMATWRNRGILSDDAQLWRLAQADSPTQFNEVRDFVLSEFHSCEVGGRRVLVHRRIFELWQKQAQRYAQRVEAGQKSGEKRRLRSRKSLVS